MEEKSKYKVVQARLEEEIRRGAYKPGERLPSEKDLAVLFSVSYMTARRAVTELVELDLLERRIGAGIFVRALPPEGAATRIIYIVVASEDHPLAHEFPRHARAACERLGWQPRVIFSTDAVERNVARLLQSGETVLVFAPNAKGPIAEALKQATGRSVVVGTRMDGVGVASVVADEDLGFAMAIDHVKSAGHRAVGLVASARSMRMHEAAWADAWKDNPDTASRVILVDTPRNGCDIEAAYVAAADCLAFATESERMTAIICTSGDIAIGVLSACRDCGGFVPDRISIVCLGDSALMAFANPPITCVSFDIVGQIDHALSMIQAGIDAAGSADASVVESLVAPSNMRTLLHIVRPTLRERRSVATLPAERV